LQYSREWLEEIKQETRLLRTFQIIHYPKCSSSAGSSPKQDLIQCCVAMWQLLSNVQAIKKLSIIHKNTSAISLYTDLM